MQISGEWYPCADAVERPIIRGEVLTAGRLWEPTRFLVDTGADRTVFSADLLAALGLFQIATPDRLGGLGGLIRPVIVDTTIQLTSEAGGKVLFRGQFAAVTDLNALDISVLGRDVTELFAVIVDRPGDRVCLVRQRHGYSIVVV